MADDIGNQVAAALKPLPIEHMIAAPLLAVIDAQVKASQAYVNFVESVGLDKDGAVKSVALGHKEASLDPSGNVAGWAERIIEVPLLAIITHPNVAIDEANVSFDMTISAMESDTSKKSASGTLSAEVGWLFLKAKVQGQASTSSERVRKTDTRARYHFDVKMSHRPAPEGMQRVLDVLLNNLHSVPPEVANKKLNSDSDHTLPDTDI